MNAIETARAEAEHLRLLARRHQDVRSYFPTESALSLAHDHILEQAGHAALNGNDVTLLVRAAVQRLWRVGFIPEAEVSAGAQWSYPAILLLAARAVSEESDAAERRLARDEVDAQHAEHLEHGTIQARWAVAAVVMAGAAVVAAGFDRGRLSGWAVTAVALLAGCVGAAWKAER